MCIAILNKSTEPISKDSLLNCWTYNDDGAGLMWVDNGTMKMQKFPNDNKPETFEAFYSRYVAVRTSNDLPMGIHFRIATHGLSEAYLHPFPVSRDMFIMHNGILNGLGTKEVSDTAMFADMLSKLPEFYTKSATNLASETMGTLLHDYIGTGNKVIALDSSGAFAIINEKAGHWLDDNWYSNDSYKSAKRYYGSYDYSTYYDKYSSYYDYDKADDFLSKSTPLPQNELEEAYNEIVYWNTNNADEGIGFWYMNEYEFMLDKWGDSSTWTDDVKEYWLQCYQDWEKAMDFSDDETMTCCSTCNDNVIPTSKGECPKCLTKIANVYYA